MYTPTHHTPSKRTAKGQEMENQDQQKQPEETETKQQQQSSPAMAAALAMEGTAVTALRSVMQRVQQAAEKSGRRADQVRVVGVSKTKPVSLIRQVYDAGHRCFGENYVQEFIEKAPQLECWKRCKPSAGKKILEKLLKRGGKFKDLGCERSALTHKKHLPDDIEWHFIGHLQSNKVKSLLAAVPNLVMVESVDDEKIANYLDRHVGTIGRKPLKVLVQVNTSGEVSKSGVEPSACVELAKHVMQACPNLDFSGLMTIGMLDYTSTPENFRTLSNCRAEVCKALGMTEEQCELSMGMSGDFEKAIEMGSTNIRIGSTIFGPREYPKKQAN